MRLGGDEQALGEVEPALGLLRLRHRAVGELHRLAEQIGLEQRSGVVEPQRVRERSLVAMALEPARCPLEGLERSGEIADESGDVGQVLLDDAVQHGLIELLGLAQRLLEVGLRIVEATEVAEQGAEVEVPAQLAERIAAGGQQLQCGLVLLERRGEVTSLIEDQRSLATQPSAHAFREPRLGDVEDLEGVLQLPLKGDDEGERHGDVRRHDRVVELDRRLPCPLEHRAGRVQLAELALGHPDRPHGDGAVPRRRVGGEQRLSLLERR